MSVFQTQYYAGCLTVGTKHNNALILSVPMLCLSALYMSNVVISTTRIAAVLVAHQMLYRHLEQIRNCT